MFQVTLNQRDKDQGIMVEGNLVYPGSSLTLIVKGEDRDVLCRQLREIIRPDVDIWVTSVHLVTSHHFTTVGDDFRI